MNEAVERREIPQQRTDVGLIFAGGTIFSGETAEGIRMGGGERNLGSFVRREFPGLDIPISEPSLVAYAGLSENIEFVELDTITDEVGKMVRRPEVKSVLVTHGSDAIETSATHTQIKLYRLLRELGTTVFFDYANNPYPAPDAHMQLQRGLEVALGEGYDPDVYIISEDKVIPADLAVKETYTGIPMKFFDTSSDDDINAEQDRRLRVFWTANELAKQFGYPGMIAIAGNIIMEGFAEHQDERLPIIGVKQGPYKLRKKLVGTSGTRQQWEDSIIDHCVNPLQLIPFPGHKSFFWPVDLITYPEGIDEILKDNPQIESCILILNHSGTAHTTKPEFSVARQVEKMRQDNRVVTFAVTETGEPVNFGEGSYVTSRDLRDAGVLPLPMHSKVAWVKMYAGLDRGLRNSDLVEFMYRQFRPDEFTGQPDKDSIYYAASRYPWRRTIGIG